MAVMTHDSRWRLLIGAAPLFGVFFVVWAVAQGQSDLARSPTVRAVLALVAALGATVAWWTARQLRAAPAVPVARACALARAGQLPPIVRLRGFAHAMPDAVPLVSPGGELCLWFRHGGPFPPCGGASDSDSARPFLLVDDSGECRVLPAGAEVSGHGRPGAPPASGVLRGPAGGDGTPDSRSNECLLRDGDPIHVIGRFLLDSAQAPDRQSGNVASAALPVITAPAGNAALTIRIGSDDGEGDLYGMLAVVDLMVLVVAGGLAAWSLIVQA
jgi:hypothetical protein